MPFQILGLLIRSLVTIAFLSLGIYLLVLWYDRRETMGVERTVPTADSAQKTETGKSANRAHIPIVRWKFGWNWPTAFLLGGASLVIWSFGGGWIFPRFFRPRRQEEPRSDRSGEVIHLHRPDGTDLRVEFYGPPDGTPIIMTHGWSLDSDEWFYAKKDLAQRYRLIVWDLPGSGQSTTPTDNDFSLEKLAGHLDAVIDASCFRPVVLLGHSIGGMIILTYCRLFPEKLRAQVSGLVLAHTTYTNPVKTTSMAGLMTALQKPLLEPLCHLMIWLSPLVRAMNWLSYVKGSAHRSTERSSFSGRESRGQLDFMARYMLTANPAVIARGFLAMLRYDATAVLGAIPVPTLVVAGDQDSTCKSEASVFIADRIPAAQLKILESSRHCGLFEHHQEFHAHLNRFVAGLEGPESHPKAATPIENLAPTPSS